MNTETLNNPALVQPCYAVKVRNNGEEDVAHALRQKGHDVLLPGYVECRR